MFVNCSNSAIAALRHEGVQTTTAALIRVLAYPKFKLSAEDQQELLADYLPWCEAVRMPNPPPAPPACRNVHDQPFLQLAVASRAHYLVSSDQDSLDLDGQLPCPIVRADAFLETLV